MTEVQGKTLKKYKKMKPQQLKVTEVKDSTGIRAYGKAKGSAPKCCKDGDNCRVEHGSYYPILGESVVATFFLDLATSGVTDYHQHKVQ